LPDFGGSGGVGQCEVVGMNDYYVGCAWGFGGDVGFVDGGPCFCREGDPSECVQAGQDVVFGTEWVETPSGRSACECSPF
jgi:hypothetical protein